MTRLIPAPAPGAIQLPTLATDVNSVPELQHELLTAYRRASAAGRWIKRLGRDQLDAALDAAKAAFAIKALVGHGKWGDWQRQHLQGVAPKTLRDWMWLYERRHQIGEAANLTQAKANIRAAELEAQRKRLREPGAFPPGVFNLFDIDIPWWFPRDQLPYEPMARAAVLELMAEVANCAADDAVAFFWVPDAFVYELPAVIEAAGFSFSDRFLVWDKGKGGPHRIACGAHELVAVATRGKPPIETAASTVIHAPRGPHSAKPEDAYKLFEEMVPSSPATRLELFARKQRPGWRCWGDQLPPEQSRRARAPKRSEEAARAAV